MIYSYPNYFAFELKSTKSTSFSFKGTTPMIKDHQIKALTEAANYEGIIPGLIFNLREPTNRTYFLHINDFNRFTANTAKSSINEKDILEYGAIEIEGKLKKVKYTYFVKEFIEKLKGEVN